uniref:HHIP-like protein 1 n=1 Tax=Styela clava TaxID=7725 RepID=UPI0019396391|nr:HHIP-like protein 1 [Styela clava]
MFSLLLLSGMLASTFLQSTCHRMCLNYESPTFMDETFDLCRDFQKFGCCTKQKDKELHKKFTALVDFLPQENKTECSDVVRDLMCQECSEYSAHQYDLEKSGTITSLPGLCWEYCQNIFEQCRDALQLLTSDENLLEHLRMGDNNRFCREVALEDRYYCYPLEDEYAEGNLDFYELPNEKPCTQLCVEEVANKLYSPISIKHGKDNTQRLFIAEQMGVVWVYLTNMSRIFPPFLNKTSDVACKKNGYDERGFLDIEFHPEHASNGLFYIYYSTLINSENFIRISEMKVSAFDINQADPDSERVILEVCQPFENHNGGQLLFGSDGYLYIFVGDGGHAGDPRGFAQNRTSLLGKILRIDVNSNTTFQDRPYAIPSDNPFISDSNVAPEIYAYGLRNPWRCSIDSKDRIICGDVGQNAIEEVDIIVKGGNYGWNAFEADACYDEKICKDQVMIESHIPPIYSYNTSIGKSITGGYVYEGCRNPGLKDKYILGDFMSGRMIILKENKLGKWRPRNVCMSKKICRQQGKAHKYPRHIQTFGEDESGEIYFAATMNPKPGHRGGRVYRLSHAYKTKNADDCKSTGTSPVLLWQGSSLQEYQPTPDREVETRLVGAGQGRIATKGRVEIRPRGKKWSTICGNNWNLNNAHVICRMSGFLKAREFSFAEFGAGRGMVRFEHLNCKGDEEHIDECEHSGWKAASCSHEDDASVWCESFIFTEEPQAND